MKRFMLLFMAMVFASTTAMATESGSWITASVGGGGNWFGITGDDAIPADTDYVVTWEYFADTWTDDGGGMSHTGAPNGTQNVITRIDDGGTAKLVIGAETGDSGNIANGIDITGVQVTVRLSLTGTTHVTEYSLDGGSYINATTNTIAPEVGDLGAYVWYGSTGAHKLNNLTVDLAGVVTVYAGGAGNDFDFAAWGNGIVGFDAAAASSTVSRAGGSADPYPTGAASWTVTFSEPVSGVTANSFWLIIGGNTATDALAFVDNGDNSFTLSTNITAGDEAGAATLGLAFDNEGVTTTAGGLPPASIDGSSNTYAAVPSLPAANTWALLAMGMLLALAAAFVIRKQAMNS